MITSKEARESALGSDATLKAKCEADLDAAIRAAATLGATEVKLHKNQREILIMRELAAANGFWVHVSKSLDQRDLDYLIVRW